MNLQSTPKSGRPIAAESAVEWLPAPVAPLSPEDRRAANCLGLGAAVVVALGCDMVGLMLGSVGQGSDGYSYPPDPSTASRALTVLLAFGLYGLLPVISAGPIGWLLGPRLALARTGGKVGVAVAMAIGTTLLADAIVSVASVGLSVQSGAVEATNAIPTLFGIVILGALIVGPFALALVTLPAATVWVCAFRLVWRSTHPTRPSPMAPTKLDPAPTTA